MFVLMKQVTSTRQIHFTSTESACDSTPEAAASTLVHSDKNLKRFTLTPNDFVSTLTDFVSTPACLPSRLNAWALCPKCLPLTPIDAASTLRLSASSLKHFATTPTHKVSRLNNVASTLRLSAWTQNCSALKLPISFSAPFFYFKPLKNN